MYTFVAVVLAVFMLHVLFSGKLNGWLHLGKTQLTKANDYAKTIDTADQMKQAALDAAAELGEADNALIACEQLQSQLTRQIVADKRTLAKKEYIVSQKIADGKESDPETLEVVKSIRDLKKSIADNEEQVETQKNIYKSTLKQANAAGNRINAARNRADQLKVQVNLGQQTDKINSMLAKYNPTNVSNKLSKIDEFEQEIQHQLDGFKAKSKVMSDRGYSEDEVEPDNDPELLKIMEEIKSKNAKV